MKKIKHDIDTSMVIGVTAIGKFELTIFLGFLQHGDVQPLVTFEFGEREVGKVKEDLEMMLEDEQNPSLADTYRQAIVDLQKPEVQKMIADFSYPDNVN